MIRPSTACEQLANSLLTVCCPWTVCSPLWGHERGAREVGRLGGFAIARGGRGEGQARHLRPPLLCCRSITRSGRCSGGAPIRLAWSARKL